MLHVSEDSLGSAWHAALRAAYGAPDDRTSPDGVGRGVAVGTRPGDQNVSPSISPDGRYLAFFSSRSLFGFDVYVAESATGRIVKQLTSVTGDHRFDALSFIGTAGTWSPDGRKFAFVVYAEGNNEIDVVDVESGRTERRIRPAGIGAISDPAWSPDGSRIAFSGLSGGISDLFVFDLAKGTTVRLTNGREAELQPAWSPDGRSIAFVTDRSDGTDFEELSYGPMQLALIDVASHDVRVLSRFGTAKAINPQFSPDGTAIYFVSDQEGFSDVYRRTLATGEIVRITRIATGVSGITALSPALSVARTSGDIMFSVFDRTGFSIRALAPGAIAVASVTATSVTADAALLPPAAARGVSTIERAIAEARGGLPPATSKAAQPYKSGLFINTVQAASVGVTFGGGYGTWVGGGVAIGFTDMVGNRVAQAVLQTPGQLQDVAGELFYLDRSRRWNWGAEAYHVPFVGAFANYTNATFNVQGQPVAGSVVTQTLQRTIFDDVQLLAQYPLSSTRRLEFRAGYQHIGFGVEVDSMFFVGPTYLGRNVTRPPVAAGLGFAAGAAAYVRDYSFFGFTSPVAGGRYRFEVAPYAGSLNYQTALVDYRHYFFARPLTVAVRGVFVGRFGPDGESVRLQPMFIGQPSLLRGYDASDFSVHDCTARPLSADSCPEYTRLSGSRIGVVNAELRIPLFGTEQFGLIRFPYLPTEIAPFVDAGVAWNTSGPLSLRFDQGTPDRVPVFSSGVAARFNLFGAVVLEVYWEHP